jgi:hypothetical protein
MQSSHYLRPNLYRQIRFGGPNVVHACYCILELHKVLEYSSDFPSSSTTKAVPLDLLLPANHLTLQTLARGSEVDVLAC